MRIDFSKETVKRLPQSKTGLSQKMLPSTDDLSPSYYLGRIVGKISSSPSHFPIKIQYAIFMNQKNVHPANCQLHGYQTKGCSELFQILQECFRPFTSTAIPTNLILNAHRQSQI